MPIARWGSMAITVPASTVASIVRVDAGSCAGPRVPRICCTVGWQVASSGSDQRAPITNMMKMTMPKKTQP